LIKTVLLSYIIDMIENTKFTVDELATLTDVSRRTIRYYIQQNLVSPPEGNRKGSYYLQHHLEQLLEVKKWQKAGLSLERIKELLSEPDGGELPLPPRRKRPGDVAVRSHIIIAPGVELVISPEDADMSPDNIRLLTRKLLDLTTLNGKEKKDGK
jgi:DNA-binding transcriptional MerR regulator